MASEPNHSAEEKLKRYAEERRKQAPSDLHPATRRMLQGEVSRVYGLAKGGEPTGWRKWMITPNFAWAVACVAMLGISILVLQRPPKTTQEETVAPAAPALNDSKEQPFKLENLAAEPASAATVPVLKTPEPVPAPPATLPEVRMMNREEAPVTRRRDAATPAPKPAGPAGSGGRAKASDELMEKDVNAQFSNDLAKNEAKKEAQPPGAQQQMRVLTRFQLQQTGRQLRFVDEDNSEYPGQILAQNAGTNSFRAAGTNQTLRQSVVITGQFHRAYAPAQQLRQQQQGGFAQDNYRVQGQALVGNSNQIQIDAEVAAPAR